MDTIEFTLADESATRRWAGRLAVALRAIPLSEQSFAVHLSGDLGAGKTAFARHLLHELGFRGPVKSPTFALLEPYNSPDLSVYHFDLYRFSSPRQWFDAGFDEIVTGPGLMLIEWPENAAGALAPPDLALRFEPGDDADGRRLLAGANGPAGRRCLSAIAADPAPPAAAGC